MICHKAELHHLLWPEGAIPVMQKCHAMSNTFQKASGNSTGVSFGFAMDLRVSPPNLLLVFGGKCASPEYCVGLVKSSPPGRYIGISEVDHSLWVSKSKLCLSKWSISFPVWGNGESGLWKKWNPKPGRRNFFFFFSPISKLVLNLHHFPAQSLPVHCEICQGVKASAFASAGHHGKPSCHPLLAGSTNSQYSYADVFCKGFTLT